MGSGEVAYLLLSCSGQMLKQFLFSAFPLVCKHKALTVTDLQILEVLPLLLSYVSRLKNFNITKITFRSYLHEWDRRSLLNLVQMLRPFILMICHI